MVPGDMDAARPLLQRAHEQSLEMPDEPLGLGQEGTFRDDPGSHADLDALDEVRTSAPTCASSSTKSAIMFVGVGQ